MDYLDHAQDGLHRYLARAETHYGPEDFQPPEVFRARAQIAALIAIVEQLKCITDALKHTAINQAVGTIEKSAQVTGVKIDRLG